MSVEVPEGWTKRSLGELSSFQNGAAFKPEDWSQDGKPIIRIQNLNGGSEFNYFAGELDRKFLVQDGDLLFCWSGSRGTSFGPRYWRGVEGWLNQHIFNCQPSSLVSKEYLYFLLDQLTTEIEAQAHGGAGLVHIKKSELTKFEYGLPPLPEQQRIAEILSSVDESIRATEAVIAQAERVKRGLMEDLLTGGEETVHLSELSAFITKGSTPTTYGFDWQDSGIPFLRSECVSENGFSENGLAFICENAHSTMDRSVVKSGDLLITITGNVGRVAILPEKYQEANINQHIARVRLISENFDKSFVYHFLSSPKQRLHFQSIVTGQAYPQLSLKQIRETEVPVIDLEKQRDIAASLNSCDAHIATNKSIVEQLQRLKRGMMDDLLIGKVRTVA